jgi:hypothetical protein
MLIEYKIKFEKDGLTITQRVEQSGSTAQVKPGTPVEGNLLPKSKEEIVAAPATKPRSGAGPNDETGDTGAGGFGSAPIILIGPIVLCHPHPTEDDKGTTK